MADRMREEHDSLMAAALAGNAADMSVYADWLEDNANSPMLIYALRWCVARSRRVRVSAGGLRASWVDERHRLAQRKRPPEAIPKIVFDQLRGGKREKWCRVYKRAASGVSGPVAVTAYVALGQALAKVKEAYEL